MSAPTFNKTVLLTMLLAACCAAQAQDRALTLSANDADVKWGACPSFLPAGCALAVLHGDPSKPNADVFLKVPGKTTLPMHIHTSAERMLLVAGELHVTYEGQKMSVMKPGTYAYGPPKAPHKAYCASSKPCVLFIAFEGPVDAMPVATAAR